MDQQHLVCSGSNFMSYNSSSASGYGYAGTPPAVRFAQHDDANAFPSEELGDAVQYNANALPQDEEQGDGRHRQHSSEVRQQPKMGSVSASRFCLRCALIAARYTTLKRF